MTVLKIERLEHNKFLPEYKSEGAAGMDLCAAISEPVTLKPLERALIPTGLKIELEHGYEAQIRPLTKLIQFNRTKELRKWSLQGLNKLKFRLRLNLRKQFAVPAASALPENKFTPEL